MDSGKHNDYIDRLRSYKERGVSLFINNKRIREVNYKSLRVLSDTKVCYMADYVEDVSTGKLKEIRFYKIRINNRKTV